MYKYLMNNSIRNVWTLRASNKLHIFPILQSKFRRLDQVINKDLSLQKAAERILDSNDSNSNKKTTLGTKLIEKSPLFLQPYLKIIRIDRPIGSWLLFWPCGWSIALAASPGSFPDLYLLTLFGFGSLVMRGAGCTINDMWDTDIDSKVARTSDRPLVSGTMNRKQVWIYLASQLSVALLILLQLNSYSIFLGASSLEQKQKLSLSTITVLSIYALVFVYYGSATKIITFFVVFLSFILLGFSSLTCSLKLNKTTKNVLIFVAEYPLGLVIIYPLMKRITYWPQLMLGMTLNWGILLGYSAVHGTIDWSICGPIYIAAVCWTIIYDTIYAHQDIADDILLGIKSTAIKFKENTKYWLTGFSTAMVSSLTCGGIMAEQTWPYYSAVALVAAHLVSQIYGLDITNPQDCASKFISNHHLGFILFVGIVIGNLVKIRKNTDELLTVKNL